MAEKIEWLNWTRDVFDMARNQKKPILLDISAVWCHWCHQMDQDSWENPKIVKLVNERYIPIKVDTDQRPDINDRYNMGGWPTTVVLDKEGKIIFGGTYIPPEQLRQLLEKIAEDYAEGRTQAMEHYFEKHAKAAAMPSRKTELDRKIVGSIMDTMISRFDFENGGFGEPKFPMPAALELLLLQYVKDRTKRLENIIRIFLDGMLGIQDKFEGGFFRYSVTADWSQPHYEKMLEVNAGMLDNYIFAYQLLGDRKYKEVAEKIISFLDSRLSNHEFGGFYGSQDADGEAEYYGKPLDHRADLPTPYVDKTIYADWNGKAISAYFRAYHVLKDEKLKQFALKTLDFLMQAMFHAGKMYHYFDGNTHVDGLLSDQVYTMHALLDGYELTARKDYLDRAQGIGEWVIDNLLDKQAGGFFDKPGRKDEFGSLAIRSKPFFDNAAAADAFIKLYLQTDEDKYASIAQAALVAFADKYNTYGPMAAPYALALERFLNPLHITVVGQMESKQTKPLLDAAWSLPAIKTITYIDPVASKSLLKIKNLKYDYQAYAQVCVGSICKGNAGNAEKLAEMAGIKS